MALNTIGDDFILGFSFAKGFYSGVLDGVLFGTYLIHASIGRKAYELLSSQKEEKGSRLEEIAESSGSPDLSSMSPARYSAYVDGMLAESIGSGLGFISALTASIIAEPAAYAYGAIAGHPEFLLIPLLTNAVAIVHDSYSGSRKVAAN